MSGDDDATPSAGQPGELGGPPGAGGRPRRDPARCPTPTGWSTARWTAEPGAPLDLKGIDEPVVPMRLRAVPTPAAPCPPAWTRPLVGRDEELELLTHLCRRAAANRGASSSRSWATPAWARHGWPTNSLAALEHDVRVLHGRCLPYGEGITFYPVAEALSHAAGIDPGDDPDVGREKLAAVLGARRAGCGRGPSPKPSAWAAAPRPRADPVGDPARVRVAGARTSPGPALRRPPMGRAHLPGPGGVDGRSHPRGPADPAAAPRGQSCWSSARSGVGASATPSPRCWNRWRRTTS